MKILSRQQDELFHLIHSMTINEKRNVILQGRKYDAPGFGKYIQLFRTILKNNIQTHEELKQYLSDEGELQGIPTLKNYLLSHILQVLRSNLSNRKVSLWQEFHDVQTLRDRGLVAIPLKRLSRLASSAKSEGYFGLAADIVQYTRQIQTEEEVQRDTQLIEREIDYKQQTIEKHQLELTLLTVLKLTRHAAAHKNDDALQGFIAQWKTAPFGKFSDCKTVFGKALHLQIRYLLTFTKGAMLSAYRIAVAMRGLVAVHRLDCYYSKAVHMYLQAGFALGTLQNGPTLVRMLSQFCSIQPYKGKQIARFGYQVRIIDTQSVTLHDIACADLTSHLQTPEDQLGRAILYLLKDAPLHALKQLQHISKSQLRSSTALRRLFLFLQLILLEASSAPHELPAHSRSARRKLRKLGVLLEHEKTLLAFFSKFPDELHPQAAFQSLALRLAEIYKNPVERKSLHFFDFLAWAKSKANQCPLIDYWGRLMVPGDRCGLG